MNPESFAETLVNAARQVVDETPGERAATARRIHESFARQRQERKRHLKIIALITATLFGSTAFAWFQGWPLPLVPRRTAAVAPVPPVERVRSTPRGHAAAPVPEVVVPPQPPAAPTPAEIAAPPPPVAPTPAEIAAPPPPAPAEIAAPPPAVQAPRVPAVAPPPIAPPPPRALPVPHAHETAPRPASSPIGAPRIPGASIARAPAPLPEPVAPVAQATVAPPPPPDTVPSAELARYRVAHAAHFHGKDPAAALAAWDAYLAAYPDGQLVLEARYDRALVLIKLARWAAAEAALQPFASAPVGSYRQAEAVRLIDGIHHR